MFSKLQYISQGVSPEEQLLNIQTTLDAGCKWVQLRYKNCEEKTFIELSEKVRILCTEYDSVFIINDHVDIAKSINADGVHLGLTDMPVSEAREILGLNKIIGGTANSLQDVMKRINESCDYIGLGPFRFTTTKEKLGPILGLEGFKNIMNTLSKNNIKIPVYAIGGIIENDIKNILNTGIYGVAVAGLITNQENKKTLLEKLNSLLYEEVDN